MSYSTLERIYYAIANEKLQKQQREQRIQAYLEYTSIFDLIYKYEHKLVKSLLKKERTCPKETIQQ